MGKTSQNDDADLDAALKELRRVSHDIQELRDGLKAQTARKLVTLLAFQSRSALDEAEVTQAEIVLNDALYEAYLYLVNKKGWDKEPALARILEEIDMINRKSKNDLRDRLNRLNRRDNAG